MLRNHPTAKHITNRAGWYFLTFVVAVTINFFLPRLGDANPIDKMMSKAGSRPDSKPAQEKEEAYLKEFGLVELDPDGSVRHDAAGKPVKTPLPKQFVSYVGMSLRGDLGTS